ncbi:ATP synthase subunit B [marine gamma proteobacterium HTCC2080]|nr:ATP synthase subunit B [marine gamma proteobacterium HTCC2080]MBT4853750.1 F0F1 ATP synthase subunit B [Halieaceae bacterium]MDG2137876.1 F0F1 ATP synthase subunit B [Luminiphilus sp.]MDG2494165.1 F0F1 ATP synthase subunit B [Luminiphilus sp.]
MNINLTLIGQLIAFVAFVAFCMRFVWPPIVSAMAERQQKIADGLAAADRAGHDLELAQKRATEEMADAKREAAVIIDAANKRAAALIDEAKVAAVAEADRVKAAAAAEVEQERARAQEQLMSQVSSLALAGAEKVLGSEIDAAKHAELLKSLTADH